MKITRSNRNSWDNKFFLQFKKRVLGRYYFTLLDLDLWTPDGLIAILRLVFVMFQFGLTMIFTYYLAKLSIELVCIFLCIYWMASARIK